MGCGVLFAGACGGESMTEPDAEVPADAFVSLACDQQDVERAATQLLYGACGGCHGINEPDADLTFFDQSDIDGMINAPATECDNKVLIVPGDPGGSYLVEKLYPSPTCGDVMKPNGSNMVAAETIGCFEEWIANLPTQ